MGGRPRSKGGARSKGRVIGEWALRVLGVALLAFVLYNVGLSDSVRLADEHKTVVTGMIVGDPPTTAEQWVAGGTVTIEVDDGTSRTFAQAELDTVDVAGTAVPVVNEGLRRILGRSDSTWLILGALLFFVTSHSGVLRWWLLLRSQGIYISFWLAHKLTFLGMFFNNVVPGATGGDLVKAIYIAGHTDKRAAAVVTVLVDRLTGMLALTLIAAAVLAFNLDVPRYRELAIVVGIILACGLGAAVLFFSRRVRRLLRIEQLAARLPGGGMLRKLDEAMFMYRDQKSVIVWAMVLSFVNQLSIMFIMILFAHGLGVTTLAGEQVPTGDYLVAMPVGFIASAVPSLPGGWGVRETAFAVCFALVGVSRGNAVALSVLSGVNQLFWSLLGGIYFLLGRTRDQALQNATELARNEADQAGAAEEADGTS